MWCYVKQVNTNKGARPSGQVSSEKERHRQWEKEYSERKREGEIERDREYSEREIIFIHSAVGGIIKGLLALPIHVPVLALRGI